MVLKTKKIIVIGAGISGLASAALLAKQGYDVMVLEKNNYIGGRARLYEREGFKFDMGPSWYLMPDAFEKYFSYFGKKSSDFYNLKRLNTHYRVFFDDKTKLDVYDNMQENYKGFEKLSIGSSKYLKKYFSESKKLYDLSMKNLIYLPYTSFTDLLNPELIMNIFRFGLHKNVHEKIAKYFSNKKLQNAIEFMTVFLGGSPYNTPSFYILMSYIDYGLGVCYPKGGMHEVPKALLKLCKEQGVRIMLNKEIVKVNIKKNKIKKVYTKKQGFDADIVVNGADYKFFEDMLPKKYRSYSEKYWKKVIKSPSAVIAFVGIKGKLNKIVHHNLFLSNNLENEFKLAYKKTKLPELSSYYIHNPTTTDNELAPRNHESLMFLIPLSADIEYNNPDVIVNNVINHYEKTTNEKLREKIKFIKIYTKYDFIKDYNSFGGSAFGIAHTLFQTGPFRPKNKSRKIQNLYYVGHSTNPGIGVPMCLISAEIISRLVKKNEG